MARAPETPDFPADFLAAAYKQLEFDQGTLISAMSEPKPAALKDWVDRGDWQTLAAQVGAESIFFVDRDPVIVFAKSEDNSAAATRALYERIWCMARPQLLFLASPGQLSVFDLSRPPPRPEESISDQHRLLDVATSIVDVQSMPRAYIKYLAQMGLTVTIEYVRRDSW